MADIQQTRLFLSVDISGSTNLKIGLDDVDKIKFPDLALMKISAYHKKRGDDVSFWFPLSQYDIMYRSKVFTDEYTKESEYSIRADKIIKGGAGYGLNNTLPNKIEHIRPDYSLYGIKNKAYGFLTRGCPRQCPFCIVSKKEGCKSKQVADLKEFWNGEREIILLDLNITACENCISLFSALIKSNAYIDFTQGLDVRLLDEHKTMLLNQMKIKTIHFAWDNYEFNTYEKLKTARALLQFSRRKLRVYVLTNFNTTFEQDLERVYKLRELDYDPYVMIFNKPSAPKNVRRLQRWVNNKVIWNTCDCFEEYCG